MNKKVKWLLVFFWMIVIFEFSNQAGNISDEKSKYVVFIFNEIGINLNSIFGNLANFAVRKVSHFMEYFILYMLLFNAIYRKAHVKRALIISMAVVFLYACSDEIHQLFIYGRSSRIRDVLIDTSGGFFAFILNFLRKRKGGLRGEYEV